MEVIENALAAGKLSLSEEDSRKVLEAYGIPLVESRLAYTLREAGQAAVDLGFPVVLKGSGARLAHKSDRGLVHLDLRERPEVERAYRQVADLARDDLEAVLIQRMIRSDREFVAGLSRDPGFGPCVMFGLGGVLTEALQDAVFRVAPLQPRDTREMLAGLKSSSLLDAFRGQPAADRKALGQILVTLGRIGLEQPQIAEIDLNPILLDGSRPVAVDALVVLRS